MACESREPRGLVLLSYLRSVLASVLGMLWTFGYGALAVAVLLVFPRQKWRNLIYRSWGRIYVSLFGVEIELRGESFFPKEGLSGAVCIFNHTSNFDIPIINAVVKGSLRWGAKIELFHIPIFGSILKSMGVLPIARAHREEVFKLYFDTIPRIKKGECFLLAPEGTRKDGCRIYPFKSGPFIFAIEAQCPIIPILIYGAWRIQPKGRLWAAWGRWRNKVVVQLLPPISTEGLGRDNRACLQEKAFRIMTEAFSDLKREMEGKHISSEFDDRVGETQSKDA
ncbi:MAG: 1-acyl-sn-glycerol-3-phosphate acyltransferase [Bdellovibrionales bacterium]|nr:1-acyl-sn-glycerol-3-phosphate acyltransferase [Bdellovibrionales bacterium]